MQVDVFEEEPIICPQKNMALPVVVRDLMICRRSVPKSAIRYKNNMNHQYLVKYTPGNEYNLVCMLRVSV